MRSFDLYMTLLHLLICQKLLSAVVWRLHDPDTVVHSTCVAATGSIASHVTKPSFTSVAKPLVAFGYRTGLEFSDRSGSVLSLCRQWRAASGVGSLEEDATEDQEIT
ncbi:hypothetical protein L1987_24544 [Smallanthus sonchifolius]|uniref:Uncharacterized protein n=1 Tax=Smallanthus sonchifolius TaxID=185202 RepID=A0ACB9IKQ0_9ASTR|nr:hypothetical protein L1987_24544 [Smallanthus sonchifolius]